MQQPGPAIINGLRYVGTGKKGSDTCPPEVISEILTEAQKQRPPENTLGAFFAGLWMKGVSPEEKRFEELLGAGALDSAKQLVSHFSAGAPDWVIDQTIELLGGRILNRNQARKLGEFLFTDSPEDSLRSLIVTVLRVRYAEPEEYAGLTEVLQAQYPEDFKQSVPSGPPIIQLADPFDGVERSAILTPILMRAIRQQGYRVVALCGRNPGPKKGHNLLQLAEVIPGAQFLQCNSQLGDTSEFGWFLSQKSMAPMLDRWVEIRHQIKKRPSLATLEKYLSPFQADIFIGSAFHANFGEKMIDIAESLSFKTAIVTFRSIEGSLGLSLGRSARVFITQQQQDGSYQRSTMDFHPEQFGLSKQADRKNEFIGLEENRQWIINYFEKGSTGNSYLDDRVKMTVGTFESVLKKIAQAPG